jgi:hypothetical protein
MMVPWRPAVSMQRGIYQRGPLAIMPMSYVLPYALLKLKVR